MNQLKYLEFQRLMKELQFVESDYLYQSEIIKISDTEFLKSVDNLLCQFPELKEIYYKKQEELFQNINEQQVQNVEIEPHPKEEVPELKRLYRDIAKTTHPDKIKNHKLNELYLEATEAYEQNDIVTLYKVCSELNIDFDLPDDFILKIREKIDSFKERVSFLENTYTFKWIKTESINDKNKIVVEYIRSRMG
jgi:hypothetical protein